MRIDFSISGLKKLVCAGLGGNRKLEEYPSINPNQTFLEIYEENNLEDIGSKSNLSNPISMGRLCMNKKVMYDVHNQILLKGDVQGT